MNTKRQVIILAVVAALLALPVYSVFGRAGDASPPVDYRVVEQTALGDSFTYQGRLTENNQPANGTYDLQFTLYGAASGSAQVCPTAADDIEERGDVQVTGGLFTVQLEFCAAAFDGDARWLEIGVRAGSATGTYTILSPRQPITPVPYALHAKRTGELELPFTASAETAGDDAVLEIEQTETTDAGPALEVDGAIKVSGNKAAFSIVADDTAGTGNLCDIGEIEENALVIPDDIANEASDLLFVTRSGINADPLLMFAVAFDVGGTCPDDSWVIFVHDDSAPIPDGQTFNVLVIKQEVIE